jgi:uncharacterized membrane protein
MAADRGWLLLALAFYMLTGLFWLPVLRIYVILWLMIARPAF